jgi:hypothetical protein
MILLDCNFVVTLLFTLLQGFEGFLSTKEALRKRQQRAFKPEDRLFSLSSNTSPVVSSSTAALQYKFRKLHSVWYA